MLWKVYKVGRKWKKEGEDKDGGIQDINEMLKVYLMSISLGINTSSVFLRNCKVVSPVLNGIFFFFILVSHIQIKK